MAKRQLQTASQPDSGLPAGAAGSQFMLPQSYRPIIDKQIRDLRDLQSLFDRMAACGMECGDMQADRDYLVEQLEAVKQHFLTPGGHSSQHGVNQS